MVISDFEFFGFDPQNQNFTFSQIRSYKITFRDIQKTEYIPYNYIATTHVQKCMPVPLFLAVQWPKNQVKGIASLFDSNFCICNCCASKQMTFLESWDKTGQENFILRRKFLASKFDLFDLYLTLGQIWK